jgi:hypothetical protein
MKINMREILEKYKISPKCKARMAIPFCRMVPKRIVKLAVEIDILKIEQAFLEFFKKLRVQHNHMCKMEHAFACVNNFTIFHVLHV